MIRTFACPPFAQLQSSLAPALQRLRSALALPSEMEDAVLLGPAAPAQNLLRLAHVLPASEAHHGSGPLGLVQHALGLACCAVELQRARQPGTDHAESALRSRTALALAGLTSGLGRLWRLEVQVAGRIWSPHRYLADVVAESASASIRVRHLPGHARTGPGGDGTLALAMLGMVVPLGLLRWLGRPATNQLLAVLAGQGGSGADPHLALLDEARQRCLQDLPSSVLPRRRHAPGSGTLADEFAAGLAAACAHGELTLNQGDGHLLNSASHTVLFLTMPDGPSALQQAFALAATAAQQAQVGGQFQACYAAGDAFALLDEVAHSVLPDGTAWCVPSGMAAGPAGIRHLVTAVTRGGTRVRTGPAIILRNAAIAGLPEIAPGAGFDGRIWCGTDPATPSADPEDLGFLPAICAEPLPLLRADAPALADQSGSVLDARWTTALLMERLEAFAPPLLPEERLRWQRLRGPDPETGAHRIAEDRLAAALEACLERVTACAARPASVATSSAPEAHACDAAAVAAPLITALVAFARQVQNAGHSGSAAGAVSTAEPGQANDQRDDAPSARSVTADSAPLHALRDPDGAVFLPWPHCFDQLVTASVQIMLASASTSCATVLGLPPPRAVHVAGFSYNGARRQHVGLVVSPSWRSPVAPVPLVRAPNVTVGSWTEVG